MSSLLDEAERARSAYDGCELRMYPVFGYEKTSYATAEDPDSERAKTQIRIRSRGAPAERARSAYDGYELPIYLFLGMKNLLRTRHSSNTLATFRSWGSFPR